MNLKNSKLFTIWEIYVLIFSTFGKITYIKVIKTR